jgi:threonine dehydrogenase-like Zn-dependent dehydrogenase
MRATIMHGPKMFASRTCPMPPFSTRPTVVRVTRTCICGSDLWPYHDMEPIQRDDGGWGRKGNSPEGQARIRECG